MVYQDYRGDFMKKSLIYGMIGGMMVVGYMKYKDGTLERAIKNMKPMLNCAMNSLKK